MILREGRLFIGDDPTALGILNRVVETQGLEITRSPGEGHGLLKKDTTQVMNALKELAVFSAGCDGEPLEYFDRINGNATRAEMFAVEHYATKALDKLGE